MGTYTVDNDGSYERAVQKLESLAYHESMELERTDDGTDLWQRYLDGEIRIDQDWFFNANSVSLLDNGTCIKPKIQSGASYIPLSIRRGYVYGALKRMKGYGLDPAQMQLQGGRHALTYGVKSSRMEESVGNDKRSQAWNSGWMGETNTRGRSERVKYGCIEWGSAV